jgi:protocatechuate 3,4-dioxygenase beta subunit
LAGITLTLQPTRRGRPTGHSQTAVTDSNGNYSFTNVSPGSYQLTEAAPHGDVVTTPSAGAFSISLSSGQTLTGQNFGDKPRAHAAIAVKTAAAEVARPAAVFSATPIANAVAATGAAPFFAATDQKSWE